VKSTERRAKSREQRAKSREHGVKGEELRARSRERRSEEPCVWSVAAVASYSSLPIDGKEALLWGVVM